jgi:hypothetical protein
MIRRMLLGLPPAFTRTAPASIPHELHQPALTHCAVTTSWTSVNAVAAAILAPKSAIFGFPKCASTTPQHDHIASRFETDLRHASYFRQRDYSHADSDRVTSTMLRTRRNRVKAKNFHAAVCLHGRCYCDPHACTCRCLRIMPRVFWFAGHVQSSGDRRVFYSAC